MGIIARRRAFAGAALIVLVAAAAALYLVGRPVDAQGATISHLTVNSRWVHARMAITLVTPAGSGRGRSLLVFLHGRGGSENSELSGQLFRALRRLGSRAPDIAFPNGGDHSYWHDRSGGAWGRYVMTEVIPAAIASLHADPKRIAIGGISMGGFGAYDLARLNPGRFCAVGGHSAAMWTAPGLTAPGAFDDRDDFERHDVIGWAATHRRPYGTTRLWLDGGDQDPFHSADEALARDLHIHMHVWPGGHNSDYWNAHWDDYLGFYASALAHCAS